MRSDGSRFARKLLVGTAAAAAFIAYLPRSASAQTVATPGGLFPSEVYAGTAGDGITTFLGVRYAASPTGALRFARPVAPAPVSGIVEATSFGSPLSAKRLALRHGEHGRGLPLPQRLCPGIVGRFE